MDEDDREYYPVFIIPEGTSAEDERWLRDGQGDLHRIIDATDVCSLLSVEALLYEKDGRTLAVHVRTDGSFHRFKV